jgi:hypothetical protein
MVVREFWLRGVLTLPVLWGFQCIVPASYVRFFSIFPNQIYIFGILALFSTN